MDSAEVRQQTRALRATLAALGTEQRAMAEKAYLKSDLTHLGVPVPQVRTATRDWLRALEEANGGPLPHQEMLDLTACLWSSPVFELRRSAVELLTLRRKQLDPGDLGVIESMIRTAGTWALADPLATDVTTALVLASPDAATGPTLDRWAADPDSFWVRRSAMLSQLRIVRDPAGDLTRFFGYADQLLDEKEFFIRKAIGWVLRDASRKRPDEVFEFSLPRAARMSGVTMRETVKYLSDDQRAALLAARAGSSA